MKSPRIISIVAFLILNNFLLQAQFVSVTETRQILVDSFAETFPINGITANVNIAIQDALTTFGEYQYVSWFNKDHYLCLARRENDGQSWETIVFTDYLKTSQDAHNGISIGICANDGTIHISFDHHNDPLHYKVSVPGVATQPESVLWGPGLFSPVRNYFIPGQPIEDMLTYPRFVPTPDGDLHFIYRLGHSGNGDSRIVFYNGHTSAWTADKVFISKEGDYVDTLMGLSTSRSQYHNHIMYDKQGTMYTSFTWRERSQGSGTRYNHDIGYLFSEDGGATWMNNDYQILTDTATGLTADYYSPGINVVEVPPAFRMINNQGHAVDPRGGVHVVMHHLDDPQPTYGFVSTANYRHHWRNALGNWRTTKLPIRGGRPKLLCDQYGNLFLIYIYAGELRVATASPTDDYSEWEVIFREEQELSINRFNVDSHRFYNLGELHILGHVHPDDPGTPTPLFVLEMDLEYTYQCHDTIAACETTLLPMYPNDDTYVRDGMFADDTLGLLPNLQVSAVQGTAGETRIIYLRFHLEALHSKEWIANANLKLYVDQTSTGGVQNQRYDLYYCENNFWHEQVTTYNFLRPPLTELLATQHGSMDSLVWDLSPDIADIIVGKNWLTLAMVAQSPAPEILSFHSKESPNEALRPRLELEYAKNFISTVADTYVADGAFANINYGQSNYLAVHNAMNPGSNRLAFLKFDLQTFQHYPIEHVWLQVDRKSMGELGHTAPFLAYTVEDAGWEEEAMTWNTMPAIDTMILDGHFGRSTMHWEVTAAFQSAIQKGTHLSIAIAGMLGDPERNLEFYSREHPDTTLHPRLIVRTEQDSSILTNIRSLDKPSDKQTANFLRIYPNPTRDIISVELPRSLTGTIHVFNTSGKQIGTYPVSATDRIQVPLHHLPPGFYLVCLFDKKGSLVGTGKVIRY